MKERTYLNLFSGIEIKEISDVLEIPDLAERINSNTINTKDIVLMLMSKVEEQGKDIKKAAGMLEAVSAEFKKNKSEIKELTNRLELSNSYYEYPLKEAGQLLKIDRLYERVCDGQISMEKVLLDLISLTKNKGIESYTKNRLLKAGFQFKENEGADEIICKLLFQMDSLNRKVSNIEREKGLLESNISNLTLTETTIEKLCKTLPAHFDYHSLKFKLSKGLLDSNEIIYDLIEISKKIELDDNTLQLLSKTFPKQFNSFEALKLQMKEKTMSADNIIVALLKHIESIREAAINYKNIAEAEKKKNRFLEKEPINSSSTSLDKKQRLLERNELIINLYCNAKMTYEQIGQQIGMSKSAVYKIINEWKKEHRA